MNSVAESQAVAMPAPAEARKIVFEHRNCSRCGGEGKLWQFSSVHGGVCFKCNGRKYVFTGRGSLALQFQTWLRSKPACEVKPGELVWVELGSPIGGQVSKFEACVKSELYRRNGELYAGRDSTPLNWLLEYDNAKHGGLSSHSSLWSMVRVSQTGAQLQATQKLALAFMAKLTKPGKPAAKSIFTDQERAFLASKGVTL